MSADSRRLLELAMEQAKLMKDDYVGIESILLAMTKLENSPIKTLLADFGVTGNSVLNAMKKIRGNKKVDNKKKKGKKYESIQISVQKLSDRSWVLF